MHSDHKPYLRFTKPARLDKACNTLRGLLSGIAADHEINSHEIAHIQHWLDTHADLRDRHPFNELVSCLESALSDGVLTTEEKLDLEWLCERLLSNDYFDAVTADMQTLHGWLSGIASDHIVSDRELASLSDWIDRHRHLQTLWPYDEVESLLTKVLADKRIDEDEHRELLLHFSQYGHRASDRTLDTFDAAKIIVGGLCAVDPEIVFRDRAFCFTGASSRFTRELFADRIGAAGGTVRTGVSAAVNYLVVGADGNPCWAYACYGRKVEKAVAIRRAGAALVIVHENDIHDALEDLLP